VARLEHLCSRFRAGLEHGRTFAAVTLSVGLLSSGCQGTRGQAPQRVDAPVLSADALLPSPRLIVGRIVAVNTAEGFAFVELATDAPKAALVEGCELIVRTADLRETARVRVSRQQRGRTLGTRIVRGQPAAGDEVVWLAP
jgi:hypothetical protein